MKTLLFPLWSFVLLICWSGQILGSTPDSEGVFSTKKLDGVTIEAVEIYANPRNHELNFGFDLFPFDPYFNGFSGSVGYTYYFNNTIAWQILRGTYVFSVGKDLSAQLAEDYSVNPETIERLNLLLSAGMVFIPAYGKFVLFDDVIQYFRIALTLGPGVVFKGSAREVLNLPMVSVNLGVRMDIYVNEGFSWVFEIRDAMTFSGGFANYVSFGLSTGVYF